MPVYLSQDLGDMLGRDDQKLLVCKKFKIQIKNEFVNSHCTKRTKATKLTLTTNMMLLE